MPNNFNEIIINQMESALTQAFPPFQIFVRAPDESLLTLTLPNHQDTSVSEVFKMIEKRTGISMADARLVFGGKQLDKANKLSDYNINKDSTLTVLGRILGGFGERAAIIKTASLDIKRGNVKDDLRATSGESQVIKNWARSLKRNAGLMDWITQQAVDNGLCLDSERDAWLSANSDHIKGLIVATAHGGNCGDYAQVVYSTLLQDTEGQYVYQVVMSLKDKDGDSALDHQFVVTAPNNHGKNLAALASDASAVVADAWWGNSICAFSDFIAGDNPYQENLNDFAKINLDNGTTVNKLSDMLRIVANSPLASGTKFNATMKGLIETKVAKALDDYKKTPEFATAKSKVKVNQGFGTPAGNDMDDLRSTDQVLLTLDDAFRAGKEQFIAELSLLTITEIETYLNKSTAQRNKVLGTPAAVDSILVRVNGATKKIIIALMSEDQLLTFGLSSAEMLHKLTALDTANRFYTRLGTATVPQLNTFMNDATDLELEALLANAYTPLDAKFTTHLDGVIVSNRFKLFKKCSADQQSYYLLNGGLAQTKEIYDNYSLVKTAVFSLLDTFNAGTKATFKSIADRLSSYSKEAYFMSSDQRGLQRALLL